MKWAIRYVYNGGKDEKTEVFTAKHATAALDMARKKHPSWSIDRITCKNIPGETA